MIGGLPRKTAQPHRGQKFPGIPKRLQYALRAEALTAQDYIGPVPLTTRIETEIERALQLIAGLGARLQDQLAAQREVDKSAGETTDMPHTWANHFGLYQAAVANLLRSCERLATLGGPDLRPEEIDLAPADEGRELIAAVTLMTDDELDAAMAERRMIKNGNAHDPSRAR